MHFLKENERVRIYIPANSLKSAAPARFGVSYYYQATTFTILKEFFKAFHS